MPRFSVILPLYNKAPYVAKAIGSVLGQTCSDFELIVVDDGSTDNSLQVATDVLQGASVNYQIVHQENAGVSTARNNGVACSRGEYLCFLDADDWWETTFLERMNSLIQDYPEASLYATNYYYVKNGEARIGVTKAETGYLDYCRVYVENVGMPVWTGAVSMPRPVFDEMGGFKPLLKLGEDFDLWIRIALKYRIAFLNELLSHYNQDADPAWRETKRLTPPQNHVLWNLDYLSEEERNNPEYKQLIDNLRAYGLFTYYLSDEYREVARRELDKVDWSRQASAIRSLYHWPLPLLKIREKILKIGVKIKYSF